MAGCRMAGQPPGTRIRGDFSTGILDARFTMNCLTKERIADMDLEVLRSAARTFRRSPTPFFVAVATLSIGIAVNLTIFALVNAVLLLGTLLLQVVEE